MFSPDTIAFLADLQQNNSRDWFQAQRLRYDRALRLPARAFCAALETGLSERHGVTATGRIFRINRDLRFSRDKTPYNTHLHLSFADPGTGAAWMVGIEIDRLVLGYGVFAFGKPALERWRAAVAGPDGAALDAALAGFGKPGMRLGDVELKRVPAPYPQDHPRADLLRRKGIAAWQDRPVADAFGDDAPDRLAVMLSAFDPLRGWMTAHMQAAG